MAPQSDLPLTPRCLPEATFTLTAAGLCTEEPVIQLDFQSVLSDALAKILAAGIQQGAGTSQPPSIGHHALVQDNPLAKASTSANTDYVSFDESDRGKVRFRGHRILEDEGLLPDKPVFTGLFRSSIFKSLLHKAKVTTQFGVTPSTSVSDKPSTAPHDALFQVSKPEKEVIPCPSLFILPNFCPDPQHPREKSWHMLDVRQALHHYIRRTAYFGLQRRY